jgi:hypothetical protein
MTAARRRTISDRSAVRVPRFSVNHQLSKHTTSYAPVRHKRAGLST